MSYYIHNVPGRLRVKSPLLKRNENSAYALRKLLGTVSGIATIDINLTTGSLLVNYNPRAVRHTDIVRLLETKGYIDASKAMNNDQYINSAASKAGQIIGKAVFGVFVDKAFEGSALSLLAILI